MDKKSVRFLLLTALCCLPLFFINVKDCHDWGDDFAQYLIQAENIVKGFPQTQSGYVYDTRFPVVAPPAYPAGFPLMLSPVYALHGHSIYDYNIFLTSILFIYCLLMAFYFRQHFSMLTSLFMVIAFAYNPLMLDFKTQILSDLPFALLLLASVMSYEKNEKTIPAVITGLLAAILFSIRGVGLVLLTAIVLNGIYRVMKSPSIREKKSIIKRTGIIAIISVGIALLVNQVIFKIPSGTFFGFYSNAWSQSSPFDILIQNLNYYADVFKNFFHPEVQKWTFATSVAESLAITFLLAGMIFSLLRKRSFMDLVTWLYILLFLIYPYSAGGFRFIIPIMPFLMIYMVRGMKLIPINLKPVWLLPASAGIIILLLYRFSIEKTIENKNYVPHGPQERSCVAAFHYINSHLQDDDVVLFKKPKALALYSKVKTAGTVYTQNPGDVESMCAHLGVTYLLKNVDVDDVPLDNYMKEYSNQVQLIWQNDKFNLYKRLQDK